jgi:hypothetical protein
MNIAHTKNAAAGAKFSGYSLVRRIAACCLIGLATMSAATAGPAERERDAQARRAQEAAQARQNNERRFDPREFDARAQEQRRELQQDQQNKDAEAFRRNGRLTPDERRDLRRQINEAGNDIYPNGRRR